jgi:hypothetical protein
MDALVWILMLAIEFGLGAIVCKDDDEFNLPIVTGFAIAIVLTLALFVMFGDLSQLDNEVTP